MNATSSRKATENDKERAASFADDADDDSADSDDSDDDRRAAKSQQDDKDRGCSNDSDQAEDDASADEGVDSDDRPTLETRFDYYTDSSHYLNITTSSLALAPFQGFVISLRKDLLQARDLHGAQAVETTTLGFNKELSELWGISGGLGTASTLRYSDIVGSFHTHFDYRDASVTATITREMLLESAAAARANIQNTDLGLSVSDELNERVNVDAEIHHQIYSDGNSSNDFAFSPDYTFGLPLGKLALGYRFSYSAFAKNPDDGYWAPQKALSNGLSAAWSFDRTDFYGRTEGGLGYDFVNEIGKLADGPSNGPSASAAVAFGFRPTRGVECEAYWTGNASPGWNSMNVGISLKYLF